MRIATFTIDGVNTRRANLPAWLDESRPEVVGLPGLQSKLERARATLS